MTSDSHIELKLLRARRRARSRNAKLREALTLALNVANEMRERLLGAVSDAARAEQDRADERVSDES